jgi:hypothetical protein
MFNPDLKFGALASLIVSGFPPSVVADREHPDAVAALNVLGACLGQVDSVIVRPGDPQHTRSVVDTGFFAHRRVAGSAVEVCLPVPDGMCAVLISQ